MTGMSTAALAVSASGLSVLGDRVLAQTTSSEYLFTLGVASGDPLPNGVVLWTRLAPSPLNGGGMPSSNVEVSWEVAKDTDSGAFDKNTIVRSGTKLAGPSLTHSVHIEVEKEGTAGVDNGELKPNTPYIYRFIAGGQKSTVGRTKTAPAPGATLEQVKFAVASCQSYQAGYWAPFLDIANQDDLDCVLHLGDYIYEYARWTGYSGPWKLYRTAATTNLASYRNRHAEYKYAPYEPQEGSPGEDYGLQDAHAQHPWICTWDDHEVVNDYAGGDLTSTQKKRRNAAYQAYYEHMPIRPSRIKATDWSSVQLYYDIAYGNLARFCVLDTRQYRSTHACKTTSLTNCSDRFKTTLKRKRHTILGRGDTQENWLKNALASSSASTWNILANQVRMMGYDHDGRSSAESYRMEEWDGYVATRNRISKHIYDRSIKNTVSVTGDLHCAFAADLRYHPTDPNRSYKRSDSKTIGTELIGTSVCSDLGSWRDTYESSVEDNPHVKYLNTKEGGYLLCTIDSTENTLQAEYRRVVDEGAPEGDGRYSPTSNLESIATATVQSGTPGLASVEGYASMSLSPQVTAEEQPRREKPPGGEPPRGRDTR
jgi:alkaline phosphatase D